MTNNIICEIIISAFAVYGFIVALYEIKCWCLRQSRKRRKTELPCDDDSGKAEVIQDQAEEKESIGSTNADQQNLI